MDGPAELSLLALVQGLTEFLPVSSSGHLVLAQAALGELQGALVVDVALHVGTLVSVVIVYRRELGALVLDLVQGRPRDPLLVALGTVPVALVGILLGDRVEQAFHSTTAAGIGLLGDRADPLCGRVGAATGAESAPPADHGSLRADPYRLPAVRAVLLVGLAQALAILPGVSRSGTTIAAGLLLGLPPQRAARLSFLLSVPAVAGAAVMTLPDALGAEQAGPGALPLLWAMALAALIGWGALRLLLAFLDRGAFLWFAAYTALLGGGVLLLA